MLLSITLITIMPTKTAHALEQSNGYSRVLTTNTGFYSDSAGKNLKFYLPYGYFVKIIDVGATYTKVSYQNETSYFPYLTGYIKTLDLIIQDYTPVSPYPLVSLTVVSDDVLFGDYTLTNSKIGVYANSLAVYYGELTYNEETLVYVYCNGYLGYMRKSCFAPFTIPTHPQPIITSSQEENSSTTNPASSVKVENLQILIVAGISVIVVSFVYFIFKPNGKRVKEDFYQEE